MQLWVALPQALLSQGRTVRDRSMGPRLARSATSRPETPGGKPAAESTAQGTLAASRGAPGAFPQGWGEKVGRGGAGRSWGVSNALLCPGSPAPPATCAESVRPSLIREDGSLHKT